jgi:hypothetical protein
LHEFLLIYLPQALHAENAAASKPKDEIAMATVMP